MMTPNANSDVLLQDLRRSIAEQQAVIFAGSGVSLLATNNDPLAGWKGLLLNGVMRAQTVAHLHSDWVDIVTREIGSTDLDNLLSAAQKVFIKLGAPHGGEFSRWLKETVGSLQPHEPAVIRTLADLRVPIITTNYDGLMEDVLGYHPMTWQQTAGFEAAVRHNERVILHLHGFWRNPESIILGLQSYSQIASFEPIQAVLRAIRGMRTMIFVGCGDGLSDPHFSAFFAYARHAFGGSEFRHYRIERADRVDSVRSHHPPDDRVFVLSYGSNYGDLPSFLRSLISPPLGVPVNP